MEKVLLIDGNSIMNRAYYGILSPMTTEDGNPTNALYGFLSILFKNLDEVKPDYILITFDSKTAANVRKEMYDGYKKNRHQMPDDLKVQMPEIKEILDAMNIKHLELADYEGDDILGSFSKKFANDNRTCYILSGDRDLFQLVDKNIIVRIPRTRGGKTETEIFDEEMVEKEYGGLKPKDLIELKALMGDSSDEIPGCPGVGPKTATNLLLKYKTIDGIYEALDDEDKSKGFKPKLKEKLTENKDLVLLSKKLGKINTEAPITDNIDDIKLLPWNNEKVYEEFKKYKFHRFMKRFNLTGGNTTAVINGEKNNTPGDDSHLNKFSSHDLEATEKEVEGSEHAASEHNNDNNETSIEESNKYIKEHIKIETIEDVKKLKINDKLIYFLEKAESKDETKIVKKDIIGLGIHEQENEKNYYIKNPSLETLKYLFENEKTEKIGFDISEDYVILKELGINMKNIKYDVEVACYDISPTNIKHKLDELALQYIDFDMDKYIPEKQVSLFGEDSQEENTEIGVCLYTIKRIYDVSMKKLEENGSKKLFDKIEIPLIYVLGDMQYNGMLCEKDELNAFGNTLKEEIKNLTNEIYELAGKEFNINSTIQLGEVLFDEMKLPAPKKNKKGYATDVDTLEKLVDKSSIIPKILNYRALTKLNSTYVDGMIPFINPKTKRIHSHFHQTITATGRISSTDPNLQNIPSREELGRNIKKAFKPAEGYSYVDADYSQVELRVLAHMSGDENMKNAFINGEDIHREVASKVFNTPIESVTKEQRSRAKAVNFGIVYGITGFGLAKQIGTTRKEAEGYIESYLEKYSGVKDFMNKMVEQAKENGYVETLFGRRRYIPELKSKNYMVREFGKRASMNSPIQGTAADIMKIAMNNVYRALKEAKLDAKIVLQVHDELILEVKDEDKEKAKEILKNEMENAYKLSIPLKVEVTDAKSWYDAK